MQIIVPSRGLGETAPFAKMTKVEYIQMAFAINKVVEGSYRAEAKRGDGIRERTDAEDKRRVQLCIDWYRMTRREHQYSHQRAVDTMAKALRDRLDGNTFKPEPQRKLWTPGGYEA